MRALRLSNPALLAALAVAAPIALRAQGTISFSANPAPQTNPPAGLQGHALAVRADGSMVLFGGEQATGLLQGTYTSTSGVWIQRISIFNPAARSECALAFDSTRNDTLLFGGKDALGTALGDTWTFANNQWNYRTTATAPTARHGHAVAFDAQNGVAVLFGGIDATQTLLADTWLWNGSAWQQASPIHAPSARQEHAMAYDTYRRRVVLFGGAAQTGLRDDVHEWNGADWTEVLTPANNGARWAPRARSKHAMGYDPVSDRIIVHSGQVEGGALSTDTWAWDGVAWVQLLPGSNAPLYRKNAAMGRITSTQRLMVLGGSDGVASYNDASELVVPVLSRLREYGVACVGSAGPLELRANANARAALGATLQMRMTGLALPFSAGIGYVGLSDQHINGIPLPIGLAPVGIPGCSAYQSVDIQFPLGLPSGLPLTTPWDLAIPNDGIFLGLEVYLQALALEGFGFSRFATVTNGLAVKIGNPTTVSPVPMPVANFTASPAFGPLPLTVRFTDTSTGNPVAWQWDFDNDGTVDSQSASPTYTYTTSGAFTVSLTVTNFAGSNTLTRSNLIFAGSGTYPTIPLIPIQPGSFTMGSMAGLPSEQPPHTVNLTQPFWIGRHEVTQSEYLALMGTNPSPLVGPNMPVYGVTWSEANAFCATYTASERTAGRVPANYAYRLPTEAEWEYCCRAGTTTEWHTGNTLASTQANFNRPFGGQPSDVGSYPPNAWGLTDVHGNVWEWCLDSWDGTPNYPSATATDPFTSTGIGRVYRGGSWSFSDQLCRSAFRHIFIPGLSSNAIGFRVVLAPIVLP